MATEGKDPAGTTLNPETVKKALRAVKDPELGLNIMDIGLVYDAIVGEAGDVTVEDDPHLTRLPRRVPRSWKTPSSSSRIWRA